MIAKIVKSFAALALVGSLAACGTFQAASVSPTNNTNWGDRDYAYPSDVDAESQITAR